MTRNERITALAARLDEWAVMGVFSGNCEAEAILCRVLSVSAANVAKGAGAWSFMGTGLLELENAAALERLIERRWITAGPTIMDAPGDVVLGPDGRPRMLVLTDKLLDDLEAFLHGKGKTE